ncbi:hypothetical protein TorRG33x02_192210 [Trema orientale]|uniref:Uncharacterized protein n=1 Tax=Trema orientale TaxID=63057 RepID=A0A2P5EHG5_TREOI|nr:hypothetical protein TorRG33x02_192210 [Trema orientale]
MGTGAIPSSPSSSPSSSSAAAPPPTRCGTESGISTLVGSSSSTAAAAAPTASCGTESGTSRLVGFTPDPLLPSYPVFRRAGGLEAKRAYARGIGAYASFEAAFVKHHRPEIYAAYEAAYINNKRGVKPKLLAYEAATHIKKRHS